MKIQKIVCPFHVSEDKNHLCIIDHKDATFRCSYCGERGVVGFTLSEKAYLNGKNGYAIVDINTGKTLQVVDVR